MGSKKLLPLLAAALLLLGCSGTSGNDSGSPLQVVTARDLAGTYTGILEGITVPSMDQLKDTSQQTLIDIDLFHKVTATAHGDLNLVLQSSKIPKTGTLMVGVGDLAINLAFLNFEDLATSPLGAEIRYLEVKNILFVKYNNDWIMVLQIARVGFPGDQNLNGVYVYQYVSYPSDVTQQMAQSEAVQYVNAIQKLAGSK